MHHEVHQPQAHHGLVDVVAPQRRAQNALGFFGQRCGHGGTHKAVFVSHQVFAASLNGQLRDDVLVRPQQKAARATGRVGNFVAQLWLHHVGHELDDVAWCAELPVLTRAGNFGQQHFIHIALDVLKNLAVFTRVAFHHLKNFVNGFHRLHQQRWLGNDEHRVAHVVAELTFFAVEVFQEREHLALHMLEHVFGLHVLELTPTQGALVHTIKLHGLMFERQALNRRGRVWNTGALLGRQPCALKLGFISLASEGGIGLPLEVQLIKTLHEEQVGDLFNGGQRVVDAAAPEFLPKLVYLAFEFGVALEH